MTTEAVPLEDILFGEETYTKQLIEELEEKERFKQQLENSQIDALGLPILTVDTTGKAEPVISSEELRKEAPLFRKMEQIIDDVDAYSWARGEMGGLDWGFRQFNEAFEGLNTGVILFAGGSNIGKSGFLAQVGWQVAIHNKETDEKHPKKAFVVYFSLDDTCNELIPRIVALDQKIKINTVRFPKKYSHIQEVMAKREIGLKNLKENVPYFAMIDANEGQSIEHIEKVMMQYKDFLDMAYPGEYTLVAIIDNFHDISVEKKGYTEENARIDYVASKLTDLSTKFDSPIVCSAEFRKINVFKRPQLDDIKSSGKAVYEAKAVLLCHNDVGVKGEQAQVYWDLDMNGEEIKMPIYECQIGKNKFSSNKGRVLFRFTPETSSFVEIDKEEAKKYIQQISS